MPLTVYSINAVPHVPRHVFCRGLLRCDVGRQAVSAMRCPGQDTRYWTDDAAFEVPCPRCGVAVELFKDESSAKCTRCGHRFSNPKMTFNCAQWCEYAEECLGVTAATAAASGPSDSGFSSRLVRTVDEAFCDRPDRQIQALLVFQHARQLVATEGGDARVALAASLLLEPTPDSAEAAPTKTTEQKPQAAYSSEVRDILRRVGLDDALIDAVWRIIDGCRTGADLDGPEFRIVRDSHTLARMAADRETRDRQQVEDMIAGELRTETAKNRARELFLEPTDGDPPKPAGGA